MDVDSNVIRYYQEMIQSLIDSNADYLEKTPLEIGLSRASDDFPQVKNIRITDDLKIQSKLSADESAVDALNVVLDSVHRFLEMILGPETAEETIKEGISKYRAENPTKLDEAMLMELLPESLSERGPTTTEGIQDLSGDMKAKVIFEQLLNKTLESCTEDQMDTVLKTITKWTLEKTALLAISVTEAGGINLTLSDESVGNIVTQLSEIYDTLIYDLLPGIGVETTKMAFEKSTKAILDVFGDVPKEIGINKHILNGSLSGRIAIGIPELDICIDGGIPRGRAIILEGPTGPEKSIVAATFAHSGLVHGGGVLVFLSTRTPAEFRRDLQAMGVSVEKYEESGLLQIIDWYSFRTKRIVGVEKDDNVITSSQDLTNASIAMDMAISGLGDPPTKRAIIDSLSPVIKMFGLDTGHEFTQSMRLKLTKSGFTSLFLVEADMHPPDVHFSLRDTFDGTISIERRRDGNDLVTEMHIKSMEATAFIEDYKRIKRYPEGYLFYDETTGEENGSLVQYSFEVDTLPLDIKGIDGILDRGLPLGSTVVLQATGGMEKNAIINQFISSGIKNEEGVVVALSSISPQVFKSQLSKIGIPTDTNKVREMLSIVDWHSFQSQRIVGIEEEDNIIKSSQDLTYLSIAIGNALKRVEKFEKKRVLLDIFSPALKIFNFETAYSFAASTKAKVTSKDTTVMICIERDVHDAETLASFQILGSGLIDIEKIRVKGKVTKRVVVPYMKEVVYSPEYRPIAVVRDQMTILENLPEELAVESAPSKGREAELLKEVEDLRKEMELLKKRKGRGTPEATRIKELEGEVRRLSEELKFKREEVERLQHQASSSGESDNLRGEIGQLNGLLETARSELENKDKIISLKDKELAKAKEEASAADILQKKVNALNKTIMEMKDENSHLTMEIIDLRESEAKGEPTSPEEMDLLKRELEATKEMVRDLAMVKGELAKTKVLLEEKSQEIGLFEKRITQIKDMERRINSLEVTKMDLVEVIRIMDELLEKLPEEEVDRFVKSPEYRKYEMVIDKYL